MQKNVFIKIFDKIKIFFSQFLKNKKLVRLLIVCLALIIVGIFASVFLKKEDKKVEKSVFDGSYVENLELKIQTMLLKLDGVSDVSVLILTDSSKIQEFLFETDESTETKNDSTVSSKKNNVVIRKNGSLQEPVVVSTKNPKITGALIVLNKISPQLKISIINSISVVLNLDSSCISILQES
ncbi:MAG: hypothetical protein IJ538_01510 [Clostridia bacterium]|nr:hypothetical protein [Clostridia bacterium]